jgi:hypothetical protein
MLKKGFVANPIGGKELSQEEKDKLAKKFLHGANPEEEDEERSEKSKTKTILIRAPESYHKNLLKIRKITGMTINGVCLELLWPAIKQKLKDLGID